MKLSSKGLACLLTLGLSSAAPALQANEVYKTVDDKGKITYSDAPTGQKIELVDLPIINATPSVTPQEYTPKTPVFAPQFNVNINSPSNGQQILPAQRDLSVSASFTPNLNQGYVAQLEINNKPYGSPQTSGNFFIQNIYRGEQNISIVVLSPNGEIVSRSQTVTVFVIRPSVN
ncbi:MAG: DUF4124 domain-containing protein [Marinagarivorans sp.]|nr:DUF4124 domain-containing protein [Marinagarivorans sp.]